MICSINYDVVFKYNYFVSKVKKKVELSVVVIFAVIGSILPSAIMYIVPGPSALAGFKTKMQTDKPKTRNKKTVLIKIFALMSHPLHFIMKTQRI